MLTPRTWRPVNEVWGFVKSYEEDACEMHTGRLSSTDATHLCISDGLDRVDVLPRISDDLLQFRKAYRVVITNELEAQNESIVSTSSRR